MSIAEKTLGQLVKNRMHELSDRVMAINAHTPFTALLVMNGVRVTVRVMKTGQTEQHFSADLPPVLTKSESIKRLEDVLADTKLFLTEFDL